MNYTQEQLQIIHHAGGHARIIAVAGSGKTQTLTAYVQHRLEQGLNPRRLLVLMYNKSAQVDFERRLQQLATGQPLPDIRTFHSLGYRICETLVRQGDMPAFKRDILGEGELEAVIWQMLRRTAPESLADDVLTRKKKWVEPALSYIERVKSALDAPELVFEQTGLPDSCQFFIETFHRFEDWRSDQARLTFSDLIYEPVQRFQREPGLAQQFADHMTEIIVDEYQDINPVQQALLSVIQGTKAQLMVVGDPDQTIYEFRGSKPELLTQAFAENCQPMVDYQLSHTFRFGDGLSLLANQVIAGNYDDDHQRTQCQSHQSTPATHIQQMPVADSAAAALQLIQRWAGQVKLSDIAVINRIWANSARLELMLLQAGVPYHADQAQTVLERHELKPFRVLFQIATGATSQWSLNVRRQAWQALLTQPYLKIKKAVIDKLIKSLSAESIQWGQALRNAVPDNLSRYQSEALFERARWIEKAERGHGSADAVVQGWLKGTDYLVTLKDNAFSAAAVDDQQATVKAFAQFVRRTNMGLAEAAEKIDELVQRKSRPQQDAVHITSIHKAKGREWSHVIIPEVNNRYFPYQPEGEMMLSSSLASERRLLYVAMTRAQNQLALLTPVADAEVSPSRLLPPDYVSGLADFLNWLKAPNTLPQLPAGMHKPSVEYYAQLCELPAPQWSVTKHSNSLLDATVRHPTLGLGQVVDEQAQRLQIHFVRDNQTRTFDRTIVLSIVEILS